MSNSLQTSVKVEEDVPLNKIRGEESSESCHQVVCSSGRGAASCLNDKHHRKLAICSIICGFSCIGIKALIKSVKAEETTDPEAAAKFSREARRLGIRSIVAWVSFLALLPVLMALISYLLTLQD